MGAYTKTTKLDDGTTTITLGPNSVNESAENDLSTNPIAQQQSDTSDPQTIIINNNQVKSQYKVSGIINDEIADQLNGGQDKESLAQDLRDIFTSQSQVTMTYGTRTIKGFIGQYELKEKANEDASNYAYQFRLIEGKPP